MIPRSDLPWKPVTRSPSPGTGVTGIPGELADMAFPYSRRLLDPDLTSWGRADILVS